MAEIKPFKILLAEDSPGDAEIVRKALAEHRVECTLLVVRDGAQAIALLDSLDADPTAPPLDLFLIDMHLPKRSGEDILKHLRATERYAQTPVIVLSGQNSPAMEDQAARHAALVYFRKPSTLDEFMQLGAIVRRLLNRSRGAA